MSKLPSHPAGLFQFVCADQAGLPKWAIPSTGNLRLCSSAKPWLWNGIVTAGIFPLQLRSVKLRVVRPRQRAAAYFWDYEPIGRFRLFLNLDPNCHQGLLGTRAV